MARYVALPKPQSEQEESIGSYFDPSRLPAAVQVTQNKTSKDDSDLSKGRNLYLLYLFPQPAVLFKDEKGHYFNEATTFNKCKFRLLPDDESFDDKLYMRVGDVMRLARRPRYLRVLQGYMYASENSEETINIGQVLEVTGQTTDDGDKKRAVWFCVKSSADKRDYSRTPVYLPYRTEGQFTTVLDDTEYSLQELVEKVGEGQLSFPFRIQVAGVSGAGASRKFTVLSPCDIPWLVAADGERLLRLQANLQVFVKKSPHADAELSLSLRLLSQNVNHDDIKSMRVASRASLTSIFDYSNSKPKLPPRQHSECRSEELSDMDSSPNDLYAYVEVNKCRLPSWFTPPVPPPAAPENGGDDYDHMPTSLYTHARRVATMPEISYKSGKPSRRLPVPSTSPRKSPLGEIPLPPPPLEEDKSPSTLDPLPPPPLTLSPSSVESVSFLSLGSDADTNSHVHELLSENKHLRARCFQLEKEKVALQQELEGLRITRKSSRLSKLSTAEVIRLLHDHRLGGYATAFETEGVNGQLFACLDDEMLAVNLGVSNRFHRLKILQLKDS